MKQGHMLILQTEDNSLCIKILPVNPYSSRILVPTSLQLFCFHRSEGEGGTLLNFEPQPET
jgi:hypothetical protein